MVDGKITIREKAILAVISLLLITGGVWRATQQQSPGVEMVSSNFLAEPQETEVVDIPLMTVHIVGAVAAPGVYQLAAGSRVFELIDLCGGLLAEADQEMLNQARPLIDGEQILVARISDSSVDMQRSVVPATTKININRATVTELTALPGIGDVRAGQIVAYREQHGYFTDINDIMNVGGIGNATFNNIADLITIF